MIFLDLARNVAILFALCMGYTMVARWRTRSSLSGQVLVGIIFGVSAVVGMLTPVTLLPGVIFDGRSILIGIAGLFCGGFPALIAALIALACRIVIGGAGVYMGCGVIITSAVLGVGYHHLRARNTKDIKVFHLFVFGVVVHLAMLFWVVALPAGIRWQVLQSIALPVLLVYPVGTVLVGQLLANQDAFSNSGKALKKSEENLTITLNSIGDAVISVDIEKRVVRMNPVAEALTGWTVAEALGHPLDEVFNIIHAQTREKAENPVERVLREGVVVGLANHTAVIARDGTEHQISDSAAPIRNAEGKVVGVVLVFRDVTELYEKEEALRQSELKYRAFFENSTDAMLIIENDRFVDCNAAAISLLKSDGRKEILDAHPSRLSPKFQPDGCSSAKKASEIMQLATERGSHRFDWMHQRKDGTVFPVEVSLTSIATERGTRQLHSVWRDMTEKREVEQALRESEARYRVLVEGQTDLIVKMGVDGHLLFVSPSCCALFGKSEEELLGHAFLPLVHEDDRAATEAAMKDLFTPPHKVLMEQRAMTKEGCRWLAWKNSAILDENGAVVEVIGIGRDITERKQVEEERARLSTAIDQAAETVVITDVKGSIQYVNPSFERITGYARAEAIGQNPRILKSGEQGDAFYRSMWSVLLRGETWSGRFVNRRKDGTLYTEEATISPVKDSAGKVVNYVAIKTDITNELIREAQFRQAQKMDSVGRLAGGIAHDFNNIL